MELNLKYKPLNLGQGLPEDLVPDYVLDTLKEVVMDKDKIAMHQYTRGFVITIMIYIYAKHAPPRATPAWCRPSLLSTPSCSTPGTPSTLTLRSW
jgi:hypothetical protein